MLKTCAQGGDAPPEHAVELGRGETGPFFGRGRDHLGHGFGLRQVHAAIQKSPAREFAAFGQTGPAGEAGFKHGGQQDGAAVTVELGHVLPGEGLGPGHGHGQRVVENRAVLVHDFSPAQHPRAKGLFLARRVEQRFQQGQGVRPADADDADAPGTGRGGDGGDGGGRIHGNSTEGN